MVHIALAFHDPSGLYALHTAAVLVSVFERTAVPVTAHIIHDADSGADALNNLAAVVAHYGQKITFYAPPALTPRVLANLPPALGPGSLYRYFLPELLDVERVIYLDCDTNVQLDINELWQASAVAGQAPASGLSAPLLSCVPDASPVQRLPAAPKERQPECFYCNSGVLVLHCAALTRCRVPLAQAVLRQVEGIFHSPYPDQDALNRLCAHLPVQRLDERFNYQTHVDARWELPPEALEGKIVHYCARKPWCEPGYAAAQGYWRNCALVERILSARKKG